MPVTTPSTVVGFKPPKEAQLIWDNWRGGLNVLFAPTEIEENELSQMDKNC